MYTNLCNIHSTIELRISYTYFNQEEDDLPFEEEILRNPYSVKSWLRYLEYKKQAPRSTVNLIYERALKELPGR